MIVTVTPADLHPGDRVLINGGWWDFLESVEVRDRKRRLILDYDGDTIVYLTVHRAEP